MAPPTRTPSPDLRCGAEAFYCQSSVGTSKKSAVSRTSLSTASLLWGHFRAAPAIDSQQRSRKIHSMRCPVKPSAVSWKNDIPKSKYVEASCANEWTTAIGPLKEWPWLDSHSTATVQPNRCLKQRATPAYSVSQRTCRLSTTVLQSLKTTAEYKRGVTARILSCRASLWLQLSSTHRMARCSAIDDVVAASLCHAYNKEVTSV